MEWQVSRSLANVERAVIVFMSFVVSVVLVSSPTTTDAKDIHESLGLRLLSVRIVSTSFDDDTSREGVLPQEIAQHRSLEVSPEWCREKPHR